MDREISVRAAHVADLAELQALGRDAWHDTYAGVMSAAEIRTGLDQWWSDDQLAAEIRTGVVLIAECAGELLGLLSAAELEPAVFVIWKLYVRATDRSRGIGSTLLDAFLDKIKALDVREVRLEHYKFNQRAARFYERRGFIAEREEITRLAGIDRYIIWRSLTPPWRVSPGQP